MELIWVGVAFLFGLSAKRLGQPPLLGFLAAGFALELMGFRATPELLEVADLGVLLLLFTIGLKLDIGSVVRPEVWAVTALHLMISLVVTTGLLMGASSLVGGLLGDLDLTTAALVGFALSFSSTVFVVKLLESRDDSAAMYGRVGIGILVVQDLIAVAFLAASKQALPSPWAFTLLALIPLRPVLHAVLARCGHGELLILAGVATTLGSAALFDSLGVKGDLGALVAGTLLAGSAKAPELSKALYGLKDLFLVCFFLTVGLTGVPTLETSLIALFLLVLLPFKGALFFLLCTRFRLRARTSLLVGTSLTELSEFGLIVGAVAVSKGWLASEWLVVLATGLAFSFLVASPINARAIEWYRQFRETWLRYERAERLPEEAPVDASGAEILIFGMGRVGTGAYDELVRAGETAIVGFDIDERLVERHAEAGREVRLASATDVDFWERLHVDPDEVRLVLLSMSSFLETETALGQLREAGFRGLVCTTSQYDDEAEKLKEQGADAVFHFLAEAGAGFAEHALEALNSDQSE